MYLCNCRLVTSSQTFSFVWLLLLWFLLTFYPCILWSVYDDTRDIQREQESTYRHLGIMWQLVLEFNIETKKNSMVLFSYWLFNIECDVCVCVWSIFSLPKEHISIHHILSHFMQVVYGFSTHFVNVDCAPLIKVATDKKKKLSAAKL